MTRPRRDHKATTKRHLIETASAARRWGRGAGERRVAGRGRRRGHVGGTQASSPRVDQRKSYIGRGMEGSSGRPAARPRVGEAGRPFDGLRANGIYVGRAGSGGKFLHCKRAGPRSGGGASPYREGDTPPSGLRPATSPCRGRWSGSDHSSSLNHHFIVPRFGLVGLPIMTLRLAERIWAGLRP